MGIKKIAFKIGLHDRKFKKVILPENATDEQIGTAFISEWAQFMVKIVIAVLLIVAGIIFIKNSIGGNSSYVVKLTGFSELKMADGPIGMILIISGAFIVWVSRPVVIIKK